MGSEKEYVAENDGNLPYRYTSHLKKMYQLQNFTNYSKVLFSWLNFELHARPTDQTDYLLVTTHSD